MFITNFSGFCVILYELLQNKGGNHMKLSARNQLKGKVVSIEKGAVNGIVGIELKGGDVVTATISLNSIQELGLEVGKDAYAVIKATSVMVGVDH